MAERIKVRVANKAYVVVRDRDGIIRVEYTNAVMGTRNLNLAGRVARAAIAAAEGK
jgi:hypothetical protein